MTHAILTAIIPIHKMSGKLERLRLWATDAVNQNINLVLIHDFGDHETELELKEIINSINSNQIKFISGKFGGPGAARNQGLTEITTQYFCFWDSDDEPKVHMFVKMAEEAQNTKAEIAVGMFTLTSAAKSVGLLRDKRNLSLTDQVAFNPGIWRMLFQTNLIGSSRFENLKWAEDQLFLTDIKFADRNVLEFSDVVYEYNDKNDSGLTKDVKNAVDLLPSIEKLMTSFNSNISKRLCSFNEILVLRQTLTIIKKGSMGLKWKGMKYLFMLIKEIGMTDFKDLLVKFVDSRKIT